MKDMDNILKSMVKGVGIVTVGLFISKFLGYIYRLIIARIGVEQYGLLSIALACFGIFATISFLGLSEGVIRFVSFYKGKADKRRIKGIITSALKLSIPLSLLLGIFWFVFSDWIAVTFFHNSDLGILFKIFAIILPFDISRNIFLNAIKGFQRVEYDVIAKSLGENIAKIILTLIAVYLGFGIIGAAVAYLLSVAISWVLSLYFLEKKVFPILRTSVASISSNKALFTYSFPILLSSIVFLILQWTDSLMLGNMVSASAVGIYNTALPTAYLLFLIPSAIRTLFFPMLTELYAQGKEKLFRSLYRTVVRWIVLLDSIIFIFLVVFSKSIIRILFGEAYIADKIFFAGHNFTVSSLALIILSSSLLIGNFAVPSRDMLLVLKRTKIIFVIDFSISILNVLLNLILIPYYGIIGAAIATAISHIIRAVIYGLFSYSVTKINPLKSSCFRIIISAAVVLSLMIVLKVYLVVNSLFYIILFSIIFSMVYLALLVLTRSFEKNDVMILGFISSKLGLKVNLNKLFRKFI